MKRIILCVMSLALLLCLSGCKSSDYKDACLLQDAEAYQNALEIFVELGGYKDSAEHAQLCSNILDYQDAVALQEAGAYAKAASIFEKISDYADATSRGEFCRAWAGAIEAYNTAHDELSEKNNKLQSAIDTGTATLDSGKPVLDTSLYDNLVAAINAATEALAPLEELPQTPEATLAAAKSMEAVDYGEKDKSILDICEEIDASNQLYALVDAPSDERIISCLEQVENIIQCVAVTEETDGNNMLNKAGSYIGRIIFAYNATTPAPLNNRALLDKGTDAGGGIEVFRTREDAEKRDSYLAVFDGTFLDPGSHVVVGTLVVRTSCKLTASQQAELEAAVIQALLTP